MVKKEEGVLEEAYRQATEAIDECITPNGLYASGGEKGYKGVWSRDSFITLLCVSSQKNIKYKKVFEKSLKTLANAQSKHGQIPNAVLGFEKKKEQVDFSSIDSSLWFIIGHYIYKKRFGPRMFKEHKKNIDKAFSWLGSQDVGEDGMLVQLPTTDWQDAFPQRYGKTINTQALYYKVLSLAGKTEEAKKLQRKVNLEENTSLWNENYYWAYRWKNHNKYKEIGEWFDSLGNLLAIIFDLADKKMANKILNHIKKNKIALPYPIKTIDPPIKKGSPYWEDYYLDCDAGIPTHYLNGGIWPFIGGFYVLALIKTKRFGEATRALKSLAKANTKGNSFPEWIDPVSKKTHGIYQAWSAGVYMLAYDSLKKKRVLI
jgi:glycogen debranching enzyme